VEGGDGSLTSSRSNFQRKLLTILDSATLNFYTPPWFNKSRTVAGTESLAESWNLDLHLNLTLELALTNTNMEDEAPGERRSAIREEE
jgi:hypothetical protein